MENMDKSTVDFFANENFEKRENSSLFQTNFKSPYILDVF